MPCPHISAYESVVNELDACIKRRHGHVGSLAFLNRGLAGRRGRPMHPVLGADHEAGGQPGAPSSCSSKSTPPSGGAAPLVLEEAYERGATRTQFNPGGTHSQRAIKFLDEMKNNQMGKSRQRRSSSFWTGRPQETNRITSAFHVLVMMEISIHPLRIGFWTSPRNREDENFSLRLGEKVRMMRIPE